MELVPLLLCYQVSNLRIAFFLEFGDNDDDDDGLPGYLHKFFKVVQTFGVWAQIIDLVLDLYLDPSTCKSSSRDHVKLHESHPNFSITVPNLTEPEPFQ